MKLLFRILGVVIPVAILLAAVAAAVYLIRSAPEVSRRDSAPPVPVVEVVEVDRGDFPRVVEAFGTVLPAQQVSVTPEVSGNIEEIHPQLQPGGIIGAGEMLVRIEATDYELALEQARTTLAEAEAELEVERGRQVIAEREWELFGKELPDAARAEALALRQPQLRQAEARIASAKSAVRQAEVNLGRTTIRAPFDSVVLEELADPGQRAAPGTEIATLAGTSAFWIEALLPSEQLPAVIAAMGGEEPAVRVQVAQPGSDGSAAAMAGRLVRVLPGVDAQGRMAAVLVEVSDPLRLASAGGVPLMLESYVRVEIAAPALGGVASLPRRAVRENARVYVVQGDDTVAVREISIAWRQDDRVAVEDVFAEGDRVIVSPVSDLLPGMRVRAVGPEALDGAAE